MEIISINWLTIQYKFIYFKFMEWNITCYNFVIINIQEIFQYVKWSLPSRYFHWCKVQIHNIHTFWVCNIFLSSILLIFLSPRCCSGQNCKKLTNTIRNRTCNSRSTLKNRVTSTPRRAHPYVSTWRFWPFLSSSIYTPRWNR